MLFTNDLSTEAKPWRDKQLQQAVADISAALEGCQETNYETLAAIGEYLRSIDGHLRISWLAYETVSPVGLPGLPEAIADYSKIPAALHVLTLEAVRLASHVDNGIKLDPEGDEIIQANRLHDAVKPLLMSPVTAQSILRRWATPKEGLNREDDNIVAATVRSTVERIKHHPAVTLRQRDGYFGMLYPAVTDHITNNVVATALNL